MLTSLNLTIYSCCDNSETCIQKFIITANVGIAFNVIGVIEISLIEEFIRNGKI